jgi:hypothetical protein
MMAEMQVWLAVETEGSAGLAACFPGEFISSDSEAGVTKTYNSSDNTKSTFIRERNGGRFWKRWIRSCVGPDNGINKEEVGARHQSIS